MSKSKKPPKKARFKPDRVKHDADLDAIEMSF